MQRPAACDAECVNLDAPWNFEICDEIFLYENY